jgi:hypothetical protein
MHKLHKQRFGSRKKQIDWHALKLSEADLEAIIHTPKVVAASRKLRKALQAVTGWRIASKGGIPKNKFKLSVAYEDVLGELREALMRATVKRMQGIREALLTICLKGRTS